MLIGKGDCGGGSGGHVQVRSSHKRNRKSRCKPGVMHSNRLGQGVIEPLTVPGNLERKEGADLSV